MRQDEHPKIRLSDEDGETTLYIGGKQAMQAWETPLMHRMADILCEHGNTFLEVGLGLGISGLRIAGNERTKSHTIVEKYQEVIDFFMERHGTRRPANLRIVHADIFDYAMDLEPCSFDGIFYDPAFPVREMHDSEDVVQKLLPALFRSLRPGGIFIPFSPMKPEIRGKFLPFASRFEIFKFPVVTYPGTEYMLGLKQGDVYIKCIYKD